MIGFVHTLKTNVETFAALMADLAPGVPARHLLDEAALAEARAAGSITPGVHQRVATDVNDLIAAGARVVVCTCSTIGAAAEAVAVPAGALVMRIDRPMAERALAHGPAILVAGALESTFPPTVALLTEVAAAAGLPLQVTPLHCADAWPFFERGDVDGYARAIARRIEGFTGHADAIVLAQASMAPAANLLPHLRAPILSSPRLGLQAALEHHRRFTGSTGAPISG
jgi:hypothetical protein